MNATCRRIAFLVVVGGLLAGCDQGGAPAGPTTHEMEEAAAQRSAFIGQLAPDFTLPDHADRPVNLRSQRPKWVVLYFYPKDDTPGCSCQATEFTQLLRDFRDTGAVVFGVSMDSPDSHRAFQEKYHLDLTLLSDPRHRVMQQYGAWVKTYLGNREYGHVLRSTFLIGPDGVIRHHWPEVIPTGHAGRVRDKLKKLQAAAP